MSDRLTRLGFRLYHFLLGLFCLLVGAVFVFGILHLPRPAGAAIAKAAPRSWPPAPDLDNLDWSVYRHTEGAPAARVGTLSTIYRLAGTFFTFTGATDDLTPGQRRAILDDLPNREQHLVKEGDLLDGAEVVRIFPDRVILRRDGQEEELWLSFSGSAPEGARAQRDPAGAATQSEQVLETNRFGKRVGETRWVLGRESLMQYYNGLLEDPERLASLFLSMKPDYQDNNIAGYRLEMEGEKDFFNDIGLHQGDVVRKVNSMNMVSQARAEFLIREFVKGRLSAVVMDVEREGQPAKLVYLIR